MQDLLQIMKLLRSPEGCPWDRAQTHQSIRRNTLEEAYEVAEAIDEDNPQHLKEELGDLLLQVVFHSCLAEEAGHFDFPQVVNGICQKLIFRHPHVFGQVEARDPEGALASWETRKREEKGQRTAADTLDAVARSLPALIRAEKIQNKAAKAGFDWPDAASALDKLSEEVAELKAAAAGAGDVEEELGDVLFAAVKAGRFLGVDSEQALQAGCEKFIRRFRVMESMADRPLQELDTPALEALWSSAKMQGSPAL